MFERFTDRARRVVVLMQEEARLLDHGYLGTEHLVLALIAEGESLAAQAIAAVGDLTLKDARQWVADNIGRGGPDLPSGHHIPFTAQAKKVFELSLRESLGMGVNYIGPEHLLLGLLRLGEGPGNRLLASRGYLADYRQWVIEHAEQKPALPEPAPPPQPAERDVEQERAVLAAVTRAEKAQRRYIAALVEVASASRDATAAMEALTATAGGAS